MFKTVVCLAALTVAVQLLQGANAFNAEGGARLRMTGGDQVTEASTYSFQVGIRPLRTNGDGTTVTVPVCTGVLIQGPGVTINSATVKYFVLTSGICAMSGTTYEVFLGTNRITSSTASNGTIQSSTAIFHPTFLETGGTGAVADLALLPIATQIETAITAAGSAITTAKLPTVDDTNKSYLASGVRTTGWGYPNDEYHGPALLLRQVKSWVVANFICSLANFGKTITNQHMCTGGLINKGPCTGDSGAPLILNSNNRVIGIATMVPNNGCSQGKPGVYTRIAPYLAWIVRTTNYDAES